MDWGTIMTVMSLLGMYACWMYGLNMDEGQVRQGREESPCPAHAMKQAA